MKLVKNLLPFAIFLICMIISVILWNHYIITQAWEEISAEIISIKEEEYFSNSRFGTSVHSYYIISVKYRYNDKDYLNSFRSDDYTRGINNKIRIRINKDDPERFIYEKISILYPLVFLIISICFLFWGVYNVKSIIKRNRF